MYHTYGSCMKICVDIPTESLHKALSFMYVCNENACIYICICLLACMYVWYARIHVFCMYLWNNKPRKLFVPACMHALMRVYLVHACKYTSSHIYTQTIYKVVVLRCSLPLANPCMYTRVSCTRICTNTSMDKHVSTCMPCGADMQS
jgi:hypothetical protein